MDENNEIMEQQTSEEIQAPETEEASGETASSEENSSSPEETEQDGTSDENKPDEEKKSSNVVRDIIEIIESTLMTVFVIVMLFTYILHPVNIVGHSMVPTLNKTYTEGRRDTDKVFMTTVYFKIKYGDILVIDKDVNYLLDDDGNVYAPSPSQASPIGECIIKRVIACGGQTIDIRDSQVVVDGKVLDEPYIAKGAATNDEGGFTGQYPITIPEGYYFVMGDNREHSTDSRAACVGLVKKDQVYGKAIIKYAPIKEFDILTNSVTGDAND